MLLELLVEEEDSEASSSDRPAPFVSPLVLLIVSRVVFHGVICIVNCVVIGVVICVDIRFVIRVDICALDHALEADTAY